LEFPDIDVRGRYPVLRSLALEASGLIRRRLLKLLLIENGRVELRYLVLTVLVVEMAAHSL
jgi:hypothetical protein